MLTILGPGIITVLMFLGGAIIFASWRKSKSPLVGYFCIFFFGFGAMHIFLTTGIYLSVSNPPLAGIFYTIAHFILFITLVFFLRLPIKLTIPKMEKTLFYILLLAALISTVIISTNIPLPTATPEDIIDWNVPEQSVKAIGAFTGVAFLSAFILFIIQGIKLEDRMHKLRCLLFAFGLLFFLIAGPSHNLARTTTAHLIADALTLPGALLLIVGVFLPRIYRKTKIKT